MMFVLCTTQVPVFQKSPGLLRLTQPGTAPHLRFTSEHRRLFPAVQLPPAITSTTATLPREVPIPISVLVTQLTTPELSPFLPPPRLMMSGPNLRLTQQLPLLL